MARESDEGRFVAMTPSSARTGPCAVLPGELHSTPAIAVSESLESRHTQLLYIPPDNDRFFDTQETPSFSHRPYDDTQEEAFFDCMEEEDDQHYLPIQQPRLNKKRKREEGPIGNNWGKKSHFFSNRKASSEHPPTLQIHGGGHTKKHKRRKSQKQQRYNKQPQMTGSRPKEKAQGSSHQCKQRRKKKRPKQGLLDRQQDWSWARR
jgi:hypothetical protein